MWALTKRLLKSEPTYTTGKWTLDKLPPLGRSVKSWLGIDAPLIYEHPAEGILEDALEFELTRTRVSNDKARRVLGFEPAFCREKAMELTLEWLRYARIVP